MKFVLACYGSRGDVEPCVAVGRELLRRGHEVDMAVTPDLVGFAEAAGLAAVGFGPDLQSFVDAVHNCWTNRRKIQDLARLRREAWEMHTQCWRELSTTLMSLAEGAELLLTGLYLEESAANVAEYYDIPLAMLHHSPMRPNGQLFPMRVQGPLVRIMPAPVIRTAITVNEWWSWRMAKKQVDDGQRRELGLPKATGPAQRRITERGALEIQAYDEVCFPGLAAEWAKWNGQRPFIGAPTLELPADADDDAASWIAAGTSPIFFGFGSMPAESPADTVAMISAACAQLGERVLVCAGSSDLSRLPHFDHVKVVGALNYAAVFPACRAVVHHGGAGTTGVGLRAGVPTLILWTFPDQSIWGDQVERLKVGTARRFSATTRESLIADLGTILAPQFAARARELATRMTKPDTSVAAAADLVEEKARVGLVR